MIVLADLLGATAYSESGNSHKELYLLVPGTIGQGPSGGDRGHAGVTFPGVRYLESRRHGQAHAQESTRSLYFDPQGTFRFEERSSFGDATWWHATLEQSFHCWEELLRERSTEDPVWALRRPQDRSLYWSEGLFFLVPRFVLTQLQADNPHLLSGEEYRGEDPARLEIALSLWDLGGRGHFETWESAWDAAAHLA